MLLIYSCNLINHIISLICNRFFDDFQFNFLRIIFHLYFSGFQFHLNTVYTRQCVAMCGGIVISQTGGRISLHESPWKSRIRPSFSYNLGRIMAYTIIGALAGSLGSLITFTGTARGIVTILSGILMLIVGLNMIDLFAPLRKIAAALPSWHKLDFFRSRTKQTPFYVGLANGCLAMKNGPLPALLPASRAGLNGLTREASFWMKLEKCRSQCRLNCCGSCRKKRSNEWAELITAFTEKYGREMGKGKLHFTDEAMALLLRYPWPGNIRELQNVVERAVILSTQPFIAPDLLPVEVLKSEPKENEATGIAHSWQLTDAGIHLDALEKDLILQALKLADGNQTKAARLLGSPAIP